MSQLTIQLSDRADALIAHLQKEIFQRRRKKVSAAAVIETLVESGARSQSDKRFATSWKNLLADIDKAARLAEQHGAKPGNLSNEEWAMVLAHRSRGADQASTAAPRKRLPAKGQQADAAAGAVAGRAAKAAVKASTATAGSGSKAVTDAAPAPARASRRPSAGASAPAGPARRQRSGGGTAPKAASKAASQTPPSSQAVASVKPRPARRARKTAASAVSSTPVAQRMARAAKRLGGGSGVVSGAAAVSPSPSERSSSGNGVVVSAGA
jgi:hypothetical protein